MTDSAESPTFSDEALGAAIRPHLSALLTCAETLARRHEKASDDARKRQTAAGEDELAASKARTLMLAADRRAAPFRDLVESLVDAEEAES